MNFHSRSKGVTNISKNNSAVNDTESYQIILHNLTLNDIYYGCIYYDTILDKLIFKDKNNSTTDIININKKMDMAQFKLFETVKPLDNTKMSMLIDDMITNKINAVYSVSQNDTQKYTDVLNRMTSLNQKIEAIESKSKK